MITVMLFHQIYTYVSHKLTIDFEIKSYYCRWRQQIWRQKELVSQTLNI